MAPCCRGARTTSPALAPPATPPDSNVAPRRPHPVPELTLTGGKAVSTPRAPTTIEARPPGSFGVAPGNLLRPKSGGHGGARPGQLSFRPRLPPPSTTSQVTKRVSSSRSPGRPARTAVRPGPGFPPGPPTAPSSTPAVTPAGLRGGLQPSGLTTRFVTVESRRARGPSAHPSDPADTVRRPPITIDPGARGPGNSSSLGHAPTSLPEPLAAKPYLTRTAKKKASSSSIASYTAIGSGPHRLSAGRSERPAGRARHSSWPSPQAWRRWYVPRRSPRAARRGSFRPRPRRRLPEARFPRP